MLRSECCEREYLPILAVFWSAVFVACGWEVAAAQAPLPEAAAAAEIEALGGYIYRNEAGQVDMVSMTGEKFADEHLALLRSFPALRNLTLTGSRVTDQGLEELMKLPKLEEVGFRKTRVTREAALAFKDRHPGVWHVDAPPAANPAVLGTVALVALPMAGVGVWLFLTARRKRDILAPRHYTQGLLYGVLLVALALVLIAVGALQAMGIDFNLSDLFG